MRLKDVRGDRSRNGRTGGATRSDAGQWGAEVSVGQRIVVVGSSSSGKSTLAGRLAERLRIPHVELDALYWGPAWTPVDLETFRERVRQAVSAGAWVLDGNYLQHQQDVSWPVAETVVWLDVGLTTLLRRCIGRSWRRWRRDELLWGTNRERFLTHLKLWSVEESLIAYIVWTHRKRRRELEGCMADPRWAHLQFVRLRSAADAERWLAMIAPARDR